MHVMLILTLAPGLINPNIDSVKIMLSTSAIVKSFHVHAAKLPYQDQVSSSIILSIESYAYKFGVYVFIFGA